MATDIETVITFLNNVDAEELRKHATTGDTLRALTAARKFLRKLQSPFQRVEQHLCNQDSACGISILSDIGLWEAWRAAGGKEATLDELWELCKHCDITLLGKCSL